MGGLGCVQGQESLSDKLVAHLGLIPPGEGLSAPTCPPGETHLGAKGPIPTSVAASPQEHQHAMGMVRLFQGGLAICIGCDYSGSHMCLAPPQGLGGKPGRGLEGGPRG